MVLAVCVLTACNSPALPTGMPSALPTAQVTPSQPTMTAIDLPTEIVSPTPAPPHVLTICLGQEPRSLFLYQAYAQAERSILQAIYDGPVDFMKDGLYPVILRQAPSLADGSVMLTTVDVAPATEMVDASGDVTVLQEGTRYFPAGCVDATCVQAYTGDQPIQMTQVSVRYSLLNDLTWADGTPLTADDSRYSFELAKAFFSAGQSRVVDVTADVQVVDEQTVMWRGLPGYLNVEPLAFFFSPLPRHLWGNLTLEQLLADPLATRMPLGWGPYQISEWVDGDHLTLRKNSRYFRAGEGLPNFDYLVYRFVSDGEQALDALLTGECDLIDPSAAPDFQLSRLAQLQAENRVAVRYHADVAWELAVFGIESLNPGRVPFFSQPKVRQAIAQCINRQEIAAIWMAGQARVPDSYVLAGYPFHAPNLPQYGYDLAAADALFQEAGWLDVDGDPATPRTALNVPGVADNTPFTFVYLVSSDAERAAAAQMIQASLATCGVEAILEFQEPASYLAAGPGGVVFGRNFDMAQFALPALLSPTCDLFTAEEIPGPFPTFPKGWAGINVSGYRNADFDQACLAAKANLPGSEAYQQAHELAQAIFAGELPAIPLYTRFQVLVSRPEVCQVSVANVYQGVWWNLEQLDKGDACP
jgi:peptide/nickel transport system substrate-binding protein